MFAELCQRRMPEWATSLERLEQRLVRSRDEAEKQCQTESMDEVLRRAREVGLSFGRALQYVIGGTCGCTSGALTLEEELMEFATAAVQGQCGAGKGLSGKDASEASMDLWANFNGVEAYTAYLRNDVGIPGAEMPLNGGAAWQRLISEVEVAMRLAHPPPEELASLTLAAVQAGGTGIHGHQRWDDVSAKLLLTIAFEPLRRRLRYVAARVAWQLRQQKTAVAEWMATLENNPSARLYSPLFSVHLAVLRSNTVTRDLVFGAFDQAAAIVSEDLLRNLEGTLLAGCMNPEVMLRPQTEVSLTPATIGSTTAAPPPTSRSVEMRSRVSHEMNLRSGRSENLPGQLHDRTFEPKEAEVALPHVELGLRNAFKVLANILANQAFAFADTSLCRLCRRQIDESMNAIELSPEQHQAMQLRNADMRSGVDKAEERIDAAHRCVTALRGGSASQTRPAKSARRA
eukprot:NODE_5171_length_1801_cov_6.797491.p1 GENE.NODE_5171_length_1801_cov_6.797491~~NODE_5171_length_1801_cov_6.797491.p1  ORF type:complete len:459 (+),score=166.45 NODE_5171_length_1801_cov_6.797491:214-1590(+)